MQKENNNNNNKNITFCKRTVSLIERFGTPCDGCEIRSRSLYTDYQANDTSKKEHFSCILYISVTRRAIFYWNILAGRWNMNCNKLLLSSNSTLCRSMHWLNSNSIVPTFVNLMTMFLLVVGWPFCFWQFAVWETYNLWLIPLSPIQIEKEGLKRC
jgi:hypothetical protein